MVKLITAAEAHKKKNIILDVRTPGEFEQAHIQESYNIPLDKLEQYKHQIDKIDDDIVIVCKSGNRATQACNKLNVLSKKNYKVMEGGITAWQQHGYDVVKGKKKWELERQVRFVAGLLVIIGAILAYLVSMHFIILSAFVGAGLVFAAVTNTCGMAMALAKLPYNKGYNWKKDLDELFTQ